MMTKTKVFKLLLPIGLILFAGGLIVMHYFVLQNFASGALVGGPLALMIAGLIEGKYLKKTVKL